MDEIAKYNKERWEELARNNIAYSRPALNLTVESAREMIDPEKMLKEVTGKNVLCLAGGGGQQSAAFALLGSNVTVLDISETQLERDHIASKHYNVSIKTIQGDMRDLSCFTNASFDIVWHAHSLNFIPNVDAVFQEVARVLKIGGLYRLFCTNPFVHGSWDNWNGKGYELKQFYIDGGEVIADDPYWEIEYSDKTRKRVIGPKEFRHSISTIVNTLILNGFTVLGLWETIGFNKNAEPGSWDYFKTIAPPYLTFLVQKKR
jgi:ubiquinone/menaquinone biosynthesis C-methylase UbiE